ncbi:MAG: hypothetical protein KDA91_14875 [Planctomycetaceae bacterium]|nr:hypothetical protein [Planctomycetaceae bacterium]
MKGLTMRIEYSEQEARALHLHRSRAQKEASAILRERGLPLPTERCEPAATNESPVTLTGHNWMTSQLKKD